MKKFLNKKVIIGGLILIGGAIATKLIFFGKTDEIEDDIIDEIDSETIEIIETEEKTDGE